MKLRTSGPKKNVIKLNERKKNEGGERNIFILFFICSTYEKSVFRIAFCFFLLTYCTGYHRHPMARIAVHLLITLLALSVCGGALACCSSNCANVCKTCNPNTCVCVGTGCRNGQLCCGSGVGCASRCDDGGDDGGDNSGGGGSRDVTDESDTDCGGGCIVAILFCGAAVVGGIFVFKKCRSKSG
jgi:hypothetical protein